MSPAEVKRRLRERSELSLRLAAFEVMRRRYPTQTRRSAIPSPGLAWRFLFVPLYRRIPWHVKHQLMRRLRMTVPGWHEHRSFGEPWRPPEAPAAKPARRKRR